MPLEAESTEGATMVDVRDERRRVIGEGRARRTDGGVEISWWPNEAMHDLRLPVAHDFGLALLLLWAAAVRLDVHLVREHVDRFGDLSAVVYTERQETVAALGAQRPEGERHAEVLWTPNPALTSLTPVGAGALIASLTRMQQVAWELDALHLYDGR